MKYIITGILWVFLFSVQSHAQDTTTIWYNNDWDETIESLASYYRKAWKQGSVYKANDYYLDGRLQMSGAFKDEAHNIKTGHFVYYFENGNKESEGSYDNGLKAGLWKNWYDSGELYRDANYVAGNFDGAVTSYHRNGNKYAVILYKEGTDYEQKYFNEAGKEMEKPAEVYQYAEQLPAFINGGQAGLSRFISENLVYPKEARRKNIEGKVSVKFVVDTDGSIIDATIIKSAHPLLDNEALRVIRAMPKWSPGKQNGKFVKVYHTMPFNFTLK